MAQASSLRQFVVARAGGACEYCRLLEIATGVTFHVEHVRPRSQARTAVGEATIRALAINDGNRMFARNLQIRAGLIG